MIIPECGIGSSGFGGMCIVSYSRNTLPPSNSFYSVTKVFIMVPKVDTLPPSLSLPPFLIPSLTPSLPPSHSLSLSLPLW